MRITRTRLEQDIFPAIGSLPIAEIDPPMLLAALRTIEARGSLRVSGRQHQTGTISENRMLDIMYQMELRGKATVHGFRGLASAVLNESGLFFAPR